MKPVVLLSEPETRPDLKWVEEVAALLPEESRLGWYQNVRPWLRMLPPDDEVAHLAYSMGYLALLTRTTPALVAAERVRLTATLERLSSEMAASLKTTAHYHQRLNDRLSQLPGEIAQGIRPDARPTRPRRPDRRPGLGGPGRLVRPIQPVERGPAPAPQRPNPPQTSRSPHTPPPTNPASFAWLRGSRRKARGLCPLHPR